MTANEWMNVTRFDVQFQVLPSDSGLNLLQEMIDWSNTSRVKANLNTVFLLRLCQCVAPTVTHLCASVGWQMLLPLC